MGLALSSLTLAAFRSYRSLRWEGDARPVALYGNNGAGKTNILEAVSLLSPGRGLRRAQPLEFAQRPEGLGWRIKAMVETDPPHEVQTGAEGEASRSVQIDGKTTSQLALGRLVRVVWLTPAMDRLWLEGAGERRRFLDRLTLSFAPDHAEASSQYERAMRERNRLLKDGVREPAWFDALEEQMAQAGAKIAQNRAQTVVRLTAAQDGAVSQFPRASLALMTPDGFPEEVWDEAGLRQALSEGRYRDQAAGRTLVGPHRADLSAPPCPCQCRAL
ncbi:MAG: DNA replication and repair protein RecF, partial [Pseudomonadota bacterium]